MKSCLRKIFTHSNKSTHCSFNTPDLFYSKNVRLQASKSELLLILWNVSFKGEYKLIGIDLPLESRFRENFRTAVLFDRIRPSISL